MFGFIHLEFSVWLRRNPQPGVGKVEIRTKRSGPDDASESTAIQLAAFPAPRTDLPAIFSVFFESNSLAIWMSVRSTIP